MAVISDDAKRLITELGGSPPADDEGAQDVASPSSGFSGQETDWSDNEFAQQIMEAAETYGVDPEILFRMAHQESRFNPNAVSPAGAKGLFQFMDPTAQQYGIQDPFDPAQSSMGAAAYYRDLLDEFGTPELALAAYNAGPGRVRQYGGIPPFQETQNYVASIMAGGGSAYSPGPQTPAGTATPEGGGLSPAAQQLIRELGSRVPTAKIPQPPPPPPLEWQGFGEAPAQEVYNPMITVADRMRFMGEMQPSNPAALAKDMVDRPAEDAMLSNDPPPAGGFGATFAVKEVPRGTAREDAVARMATEAPDFVPPPPPAPREEPTPLSMYPGVIARAIERAARESIGFPGYAAGALTGGTGQLIQGVEGMLGLPPNPLSIAPGLRQAGAGMIEGTRFLTEPREGTPLAGFEQEFAPKGALAHVVDFVSAIPGYAINPMMRLAGKPGEFVVEKILGKTTLGAARHAAGVEFTTQVASGVSRRMAAKIAQETAKEVERAIAPNARLVARYLASPLTQGFVYGVMATVPQENETADAYAQRALIHGGATAPMFAFYSLSAGVLRRVAQHIFGYNPPQHYGRLVASVLKKNRTGEPLTPEELEFAKWMVNEAQRRGFDVNLAFREPDAAPRPAATPSQRLMLQASPDAQRLQLGPGPEYPRLPGMPTPAGLLGPGGPPGYRPLQDPKRMPPPIEDLIWERRAEALQHQDLLNWVPWISEAEINAASDSDRGRLVEVAKARMAAYRESELIRLASPEEKALLANPKAPRGLILKGIEDRLAIANISMVAQSEGISAAVPGSTPVTAGVTGMAPEPSAAAAPVSAAPAGPPPIPPVGAAPVPVAPVPVAPAVPVTIPPTEGGPASTPSPTQPAAPVVQVPPVPGTPTPIGTPTGPAELTPPPAVTDQEYEDTLKAIELLLNPQGAALPEGTPAVTPPEPAPAAPTKPTKPKKPPLKLGPGMAGGGRPPGAPAPGSADAEVPFQKERRKKSFEKDVEAAVKSSAKVLVNRLKTSGEKLDRDLLNEYFEAGPEQKKEIFAIVENRGDIRESESMTKRVQVAMEEAALNVEGLKPNVHAQLLENHKSRLLAPLGSIWRSIFRYPVDSGDVNFHDQTGMLVKTLQGADPGMWVSYSGRSMMKVAREFGVTPEAIMSTLNGIARQLAPREVVDLFRAKHETLVEISTPKPASTLEERHRFVADDGVAYEVVTSNDTEVILQYRDPVTGELRLGSLRPTDIVPYVEALNGPTFKPTSPSGAQGRVRVPGGAQGRVVEPPPAADGWAKAPPQLKQLLIKAGIYHYSQGTRDPAALGAALEAKLGPAVRPLVPGLIRTLNSLPAFKETPDAPVEPKPAAPVAPGTPGGEGVPTAHPQGTPGGRGADGGVLPEKPTPPVEAGKPAVPEAKPPAGGPTQVHKPVVDPNRLIREGGIATPNYNLYPAVKQNVMPSAVVKNYARLLGFDPLPHQVENVNRAAMAFEKEHSFLLGDGTGTGKTASAGMIIDRLFLERDPLARVIYVVKNSDLRAQATSDVLAPLRMKTRDFAADGGAFKPGKRTVNFITYAKLREMYDRKQMGKIEAYNPDLIVIDECQELRNWYTGGTVTALAGELATRMSEKTRTLFMSATPYESILHTGYLSSMKLWWKKWEPHTSAAPGARWGEWMSNTLGIRWDEVQGNWIGLSPKKLKNFYENNVMTGRLSSSEIDFSSIKDKNGKPLKMTVKMRMVPLTPDQSAEYDRVDQFFHEFIEDLKDGPARRVAASLRYFVFRALDESQKIDKAITLAREAKARGFMPIVTMFLKEDVDFGRMLKEYQQGKRKWKEGSPMPFICNALLSAGIKIDSPVDRMAKEFPNFVHITGRQPSGGWARKASLEAIRTNDAEGVFLTMRAGGTGISAHDKGGKDGKTLKPRVQINISLPDTAMEMKQVAGRGFRLGSQSDCVMFWLYNDTPTQKKKAKVVGFKNLVMGAAVEGIEQNPTTDEMIDFDFPDIGTAGTEVTSAGERVYIDFTPPQGGGKAERRSAEDAPKVLQEPSIEGKPLAPVRYKGFQEGFGKVEGMHLWDLVEGVPGHNAGSTVSTKTLEDLGYVVPSPGYDFYEGSRERRALGEGQRGAPEAAMVELQAAQIAQLYGWVAEHVGDLTQRIASGQWDAVEEKVEKTLRALEHRYGFEKEVREQIVSNARYQEKSVQEFEATLAKLSRAYAEAHKKLVPYDRQTRLAQQAAVAVGEWRFADAVSALESLRYSVMKQREARAAEDPSQPQEVADLLKDIEGAAKTTQEAKQPAGIRRVPVTQPPQNVEGPIQKVKSRYRMVMGVTKALGVKIGKGRMASKKNVLGWYKPGWDQMRQRLMGDIDTTAHEIGHRLEKVFFGFFFKPGQGIKSSPWAQYAKELLPISSPPHNLSEGFAEFLRYYITDPLKAKQVAPGFYDEWLRFLNPTSERPKLTEWLRDRKKAHADYIAWQTDNEIRRIRMVLDGLQYDYLQHIMGSDEAVVDSTIESAAIPGGRLSRINWTDFQRVLLDDMYPFRRARDVIYKMIDAFQQARLGPGADPSIMASLVRGRWMRALVYANEYTFYYGSPGQKKGEALKPIYEEIGVDWMEYERYAKSKRALDLLKMRGWDPFDHVGFHKDRAQRIVTKSRDKMQPYYTRVKHYGNGLLDYLVAAGLMTPKTRARIAKENIDYSPLVRVFDPEERLMGGVGGAPWANMWSPIKRIKGDDHPTLPAIEALYKMTFMVHDRVEKNDLLMGLVRMANMLSRAPHGTKPEGLADLVEIVPKERWPITLSVGQVLAEVNKIISHKYPGVAQIKPQNIGAPDEILQELFTIFQDKITPPEAPYVWGWENGERVYVRLHPYLYDALMNMDAREMNWLVSMASKERSALMRAGAETATFGAKSLRFGAVGISPRYWARAVFRDIPAGFFYTDDLAQFGFHFAKTALEMFKAGMKGEVSDIEKKYMAGGGGMGTFVGLRPEDIAKYIQRSLYRARNPEASVKDAKHLGMKIVDGLLHVGHSLDLLPRISEARVAGLDKATGRSQISATVAKGRENPQDYGRMGILVRAISSVSAFFGANVGGREKFFREALKDHPARFWWRMMLLVGVPTLLYYFSQRDDERWRNWPQSDKDRNFIIFPPESLKYALPKDLEWWADAPLRLPKPYDIWDFGTGIERALEGHDFNDPGAVTELGKHLLEDSPLNPWALVPDTVLPFLEVYMNENTRLHRPIHPERGEPRVQAYPGTSDTAKTGVQALHDASGGRINISPADVEHVIGGFTGQLGRGALGAADALGHKVGGMKGSAPAMQPADVPVVGGFYGRIGTMTTETTERFYKSLDRVRMVKQTLSIYNRQDPDRAGAYFKQHEQDIRAAPFMEKIAKAVGPWRDKYYQVRNDQKLTPDEKLKQMIEISKTIDGMLGDALQELYGSEGPSMGKRPNAPPR